MPIKFFNGFGSQKFFQTVLVAFVAVQILSWLVSSVSDIPILKGGFLLFLFMVVILFVTLYSIGENITTLDLRRDGLFIVLVFGTIGLLFILLPSIIPEIFSTNGMEIREVLRETIGQIVNIGSTGVAG